ncbi:MAG: DHHA1 domain-containing protein, partial [Planctomycetota bacterium]
PLRDALAEGSVSLSGATTPDRAVGAIEQLASEVRALKKELTSGKSTDHNEEFSVATDVTVSSVDDYAGRRSAVREVARRMNVSQEEALSRIESLLNDRRELIAQLKQATAGGKITADDLIAKGDMVGDDLVVVAEVPGANPNVMRGWIDQIRKKASGGSAVLLATVQGEKVLLVGGLSRTLVDRGLKAGQWVGDAAKRVGGGGGGRPDMAQAGGKNPAELPAALDAARQSMIEQLGS